MKRVLKWLLCCIFFTRNGTIQANEVPLKLENRGFVTFNCDNDSESSLCGTRCSCSCYDCGITTFIPRSQGANTSRELIGWQRQLFMPYCENYTTLALTAEYTRSYRASRIARMLFCTDCLTFTGSQAHRNNGAQVVADYFGLPINFRGSLLIKPRIENYIIDINMFFGLEEWWPGLYLRFHTPITHTRWALNLNECMPCGNRFKGDDAFPGCYMFSDSRKPICSPDISCSTESCQLLNPISILATNTNCTTHSLREALSGDFTFGDMTERWCFGKFDFCARNKTALADLDVIIGWNCPYTESAHFGLYALMVVPTGNKPKAKYVFEPIAGNGKHWELGIGISSHISLYDDGYSNGSSMRFYLEGNVTNVFRNHQRRSFDFTHNGLLSRYILLKEYDVDFNYIGRMINAINFATRTAEVHVGYKVDLSVKFAFQHCGWMADLGYNLWARSGETVCIETRCPCDIDQRIFSIKGLEGVCCANYTIMNDMILAGDETFVRSPAAQPNATMFTAILPQSTGLTPGSTDVCLGYNSLDSGVIEEDTPVSALKPPEFILTTSNPSAPGTPFVRTTCSDLDPNSAAQCSMLTHKVFGHIGYVFGNSCYAPHVGVGFEIELDGRKIHNALNQWGVWLKGGITF